MSLKKQLESLGVGESLITQHQRTGIYTAAKRAGRIVKTEEVEGGIKVTRIDDELPPLASAIVAIQGLPVADRLKVFENFELCCGMNKGGCVCLEPVPDLREFPSPLPQRPLVADYAPIPPPVEVKIAPPEDWEGWSEERETVENGDKITYRLHFKTGRTQEIRRESDLNGA